MRAYGFNEYGGPESLGVLELPAPAAGPGELVVAVHAAGVNPVDWKYRAGILRDFVPLELPAVFGSEVAGVVEQVGPGVAGFAVGDEVLGTPAAGAGGYAELTRIPAAAATKKPATVSFVEAATLPVAAATAYDAVVQLGLEPGSTVLINGAGGGIGVVATQLARRRGATVIGIASEAKRSFVESHGATAVAYGDGVAERVRAVAPQGVDAILDVVGGDPLRAVAGLLPDGARLVTTADPVTAAQFGGAAVQRDQSGAALAEVAGLVADGTLTVHVDHIFPLEQAGDALALVEAGHARGKVVIQVR